MGRPLVVASGVATRDGLSLDAIDQITEQHVVHAEQQLVEKARAWIRASVGARLTTVDLMARLQHSGIPTRLLDFTSNPLIALYFVVADMHGSDGRLVVAAARGVASDAVRNAFEVPWRAGATSRPADWSEQLYAMDDHLDFLRIIRQEGAFITGGTPSTRPQRRLNGVPMNAAQVRRSMSISLALHSWTQAEAAVTGAAVPGRAPTVASALTIRVPSAQKPALQAELEASGITWAYIFPDPDGLRSRGPHASLLSQLA